MKPIYTISYVAMIAFAALSFSFAGNQSCNTVPVAAKGFAVVELFTSEGCSSCPPADDAAIALAKEFPGNVYFLGFHVDYWDYIGWKDVFAQPSYTERQREYGETFHLSSVYTPQVVVNGKKELVGSKENQLRAIIQEELKAAATSVVELNGKSNGKNTVTANYDVTGKGKQVLHIALVQLKATTEVKRGENNGHQLHHINVVRDFRSIEINGMGKGTVDLDIPAGLSVKEIKLIAYIQDKNTGKISGATEVVPE